MGHCQHHNTDIADTRLYIAIGINLLLTLAQFIGGMISGSLSLMADALHNLSDAASFGIALIARKIGRKPADTFRTFGYKRAEIIAALINLTTLILIGFYLIGEALWRFFQPEVIEGWTVIIVAGIALMVDLITAALTFRMAKDSINMKAAFLHNLSDALASLAVIAAGTLILLYGWVWLDSLLTLIIAGYVLWQGFTMLPKTIHLLMQGTPKHLSLDDVREAMCAVEGVSAIHHLHIWQLDEHHNALEAHIVIQGIMEFSEVEQLKHHLKALLSQQFHIGHATLEFEDVHSNYCKEKEHH